MTVRIPTKKRKVHTVLSTTSKLLRFKECSCKTAIAVGFHLLGSFYLGKEYGRYDSRGSIVEQLYLKKYWSDAMLKVFFDLILHLVTTQNAAAR